MTGRSRTTRYEAERKKKSRRALRHYARVQRRKATRGQRRAVLIAAFALAFATGFTAGNGNTQAWLGQLEEPAQTIERISVLGNKQIAAEEIAMRSGIDRGAALDAIDFADATTRIESHPWLRSAELRRLPGGDVLAIVEERSAVAALHNNASDTWQAVDRDGVAFAEIDPQAHPDLLRLRSEETTSSAEDLASAIELSARVSASGIPLPAEIVLPMRSAIEPERVALGWRLILADSGPEIVLGAHPSDERLARLAELLDARLDAVRSAERIDLRFRDRAILRAADEANAANDKNNRAGESARATSLGERPASA